MRTSIWDILRLAWVLFRHPHRKHWRIGQIISNAHDRHVDSFYTENDKLIFLIKEVHPNAPSD